MNAWWTNKELDEHYTRSRCVVVPSVFEGFGIIVIEALAAGTRVVGTDSDGIREIRADGCRPPECGNGLTGRVRFILDYSSVAMLVWAH